MFSIPFVLKYYNVANILNTQGIDFIISIVRLAAFELPFIWLAGLSSKRLQQAQRIYEEYAHKYATAMTYVGVKKEAKELQPSGGTVNISDEFVLSVFNNPSITLEKEIKTDNPLAHFVFLAEKIGIDTAKSIIENIKKPL